jgi:hypothetical protein
MITLNTINEVSAAFGDNPIQVTTTDDFDNHSIQLNIAYDKLNSTNITPYTKPIPGSVNIPTLVDFGVAHTFKTGDEVYINDTDDLISGTSKVIKVLPQKIVIDKQITTGQPTDIDVYKTSTFNAPFINNEAVFNLKNELNTFVNSSYKNDNIILNANSTRFTYDLFVAEKYSYELQMEDMESSDNVTPSDGFVTLFNTSIVSLTGIPFKIGDKININQDFISLNFPSYQANNGQLRFVGEITDPILVYLPQTTVNIIGNSFYSGPAQVVDVSAGLSPTRALVTVNIPYTGSHVGTASTLVGLVRPLIEGAVIITDIYIDGTNGLTIVTDKQWDLNLGVALPSTVKYAQGRRNLNWNSATDTDLIVFQGNVQNFDWTVNNMNKYLCDTTRNYALNYISTILPQYTTDNINTVKKVMINRDDMSYGLLHTLDNISKENAVEYLCYDSNYNLINEIVLINTTELIDYYFPMSLKQLLDNTSKVEGVGLLSNTYNDVKYYEIRIWRSVSFLTRKLVFEVSGCSDFEQISLCYRDDFGSLISFPVNESRRKFTEIEQEIYYKNTGNFQNNTWNHDTNRNINIYNNKSVDKYRLTTDWINDYQRTVVIPFLESNDKYLYKDSTLIPINVINDEIEHKQNRVDLIYNYTFDVQEAFNKFRK